MWKEIVMYYSRLTWVSRINAIISVVSILLYVTDIVLVQSMIRRQESTL